MAESIQDTLGSGERTIEYEANQLSGVFKASKTTGERDIDVNDFYLLENGNVGLLLEVPIVELQTSGNYESYSFTVLIEYVRDYPISPPIVHLQKPKLEPTETPHMYTDRTICYLKADEDWFSDYTSYEVAQMIKTWLYAYVKWQRKGIWDWEEHPEPPVR